MKTVNQSLIKTLIQYDVPSDKLEALEKEIKKLQNEEVKVDIKKLSLDDVEKADLSPRELMSIEYMLED